MRWPMKGVVVTFVDITQLKQAQERAQRLATVLIDSNDAITLRDFDGRITAWNRGAQQMYGYTQAKALRMNMRDIIPEAKRADRAVSRVAALTLHLAGLDPRLCDRRR